MTGYIAPSLLEADYQRLGEELRILELAHIKILHIDVMDGNFVPNFSFGFKLIQNIRKATDMKLDIHMMVQHPERYIKKMYDSGADSITIHYEACDNAFHTIQEIKKLGLKSGIALNPDTPLSVLTNDFFPVTDIFHIMTVAPGIENQTFLNHSYEKVRTLKNILFQTGSNALIEVDGGINFTNAKNIYREGADILVSGKALFSGNLYKNIIKMNNIIKEAL